jgi:hypothetical protein
MSHAIACLDLDAGTSKRVISFKKLFKSLPSLKILKLKGCTVKALEGVKSSGLQVFWTSNVTFLQAVNLGVFPRSLEKLRMVGHQAYPITLVSSEKDYFSSLTDLWLFGMDLSAIQLPLLPNLLSIGLYSTREASNVFSYDRAPRLKSALLQGNGFILDSGMVSRLPMTSLVHTEHFREPIEVDVSLLPNSIEYLILVGTYLLKGHSVHLSLNHLHLRYCHVVDVQTLSPLPSLTVLDLSHITFNSNQDHSLWKSFFKECKSLRVVTLCNIPFFPESFDECPQLRSLDLTCTESRSLSVSSLSENLQVLCLHGIILQDHPTRPFQKLTRLELRRIDSATDLILACPNLHSLVIDSQVSVNISRMTSFDQVTHLKTTVPLSLALFPSLRKLEVDGHAFEKPWMELDLAQVFSVEELTFRNMAIDLCKHRFPNLSRLDIDCCQLKCLSFLHQCPRLQALILQGNSLPKKQLDTLWYWKKRISYFCFVPHYAIL